MSSTILEVFERSYPTASWEACDELLWLTPYPTTSGEAVVKRIEEIREKYGPNISDAINGLYAEIDEQFRQYKKNHPEDFKC